MSETEKTEGGSLYSRIKKLLRKIKTSTVEMQWNSSDSKALFLVGGIFIIWLLFEKRLLRWIDKEIFKGILKEF